uniref:Immunoglobulin subtype domain-containing protein n=1 Tax=Esox lucius TaxID=8010 RepID=A0A3P9A063_ESOLU
MQLKKKIVLLFILIKMIIMELATVSSLFVEKGQKVQLDVPGYAECKEKIDSKALFFWEFNPVGIVVTYSTLNTVVFPKYKGRVNFSEGNLSLLLENVQEGDSGSYTAFILSGYMLVCLLTLSGYLFSGRVEPPVLTVDSSTNGTCNVTVTCRGQNTTVTSICNSSTCSQVGGGSSGAETSTVSLLSIYVAGDSIICNHSNQVSWANDNKEIALICLSDAALVCFSLLNVCICLCLLQASVNGGAGGGKQVNQFSGPESPTIYSLVQRVDSPTMQGDPPVEQPMTHKPPETISTQF